ncbi:MAG: glycosyltransferase family 4 protein [Acutalibacteraceae bacterium]|nr:glycosyltransferase family 4 protein [Acutalibacteraceae bacterium]
MTIVFFSSVFNHHSMPLCDALNSLPNVNCYFVSTMEEEEQRKTLGYHGYNREYVIEMWASEENRQKALKLALEADVMIAGVYPYEFLKKRLKKGKLTFICQERLFKFNATILQRARVWFYIFRKFTIFKNRPLYLLSIGKGTAKDYKSIGFYKDKSFNWAYFPPFLPQNIKDLMDKKQSNQVEILFVGRMIALKHPEFSLKATKLLIEKGYNVHLTYVGTGPLEEELKKEAALLDSAVTFLGAMPPEKVREQMEKANIFTFTSNIYEGWGAVVNEAMNAGCALVADSAPGAVQNLIESGYNGLVYGEENFEEFFEKLESLVKNPHLTRKLGENAYQTIAESYNATVAAERFYMQCDALLNKKPLHKFTAGPMKFINNKSSRKGEK